ncbi:MAG: methyl-accepting chemotaxis protein [Clostridiales bacterium]|nr:methyl-accepting chemotaxis protein [Clostridiales bacterium]
MKKKGKVKFSIRSRLILGFVLSGILASAFVGTLAYNKMSSYAMENLKEKLLASSQIGAATIDAAVNSSLQPGDETSEAYLEQMEKLNKIKDSLGLTYIYTYSRLEGDKVYFAIDASTDEDKAMIGDESDIDDTISAAFSGKASVGDTPYTDKWGTFLSSAAPILDSSNNVTGVVGTDISLESVIKMQQNLLFVIILCILGSIVISIVLALFMSNIISRPIKSLVTALEDINKNSGDLTQKINIHTGDEIEVLADATNSLLSNILSIVSKIRSTSLDINNDTHEISDSINIVTNSSEAITSAIAEIASNSSLQFNVVTESGQKLQNLSDIMEVLSLNSNEIKASTSDVTKLISECKSSMVNLKTQAENSASVLSSASEAAGSLEENSKKISGILEVITAISEQTNLLALNAAIEAARAGEQGKGFAVVADEIRKLAENTTASTRDIAGYVEIISGQSKTTSSVMNNIVDTMNVQSDFINHASESIGKINSSIQLVASRVDAITGEIDKSCENERAIVGLNAEIQKASENMASSAQEVNASQEEQGSMIEMINLRLGNLNNLTDELKTAVDRFKV